MNRDEAFRQWYDAREGTKYESFAYDAWCAAWEQARKPSMTKCDCLTPERCDLYDTCLRGKDTQL